MMQAIEVHFLGPTDHRNPRWKATADAGSVTIDQPDRLAGMEAARAAAEALRDKLGWTEANGYGPMFGGGLPRGQGFAFVLAGRNELADALGACSTCTAPLYGFVRVHHHDGAHRHTVTEPCADCGAP